MFANWWSWYLGLYVLKFDQQGQRLNMAITIKSMIVTKIELESKNKRTIQQQNEFVPSAIFSDFSCLSWLNK